MALNNVSLKLVAPYMTGRVLALGYPDLLVSEQWMWTTYQYKPTKFTDNGAWHHVRHALPETQEFVEFMGGTLTCVDIHASRGMEIVADLNEPQDFGEFDLVIDAGTLEHCCNFGQAMMNAANAVAVDGVIFHGSPMTMVNHGFFNLNPTLFHDFYRQNDWNMVHLSCHQGEKPIHSHPTGRFAAPGESCIYFLAQRMSDKALKWPMQTKYRVNPELRVA